MIQPALRSLLFLSTLFAATSSLAASPAQIDEQQRALHVLNRLGYGPRPDDVERVVAMGVDRYIAQQLHPENIPESTQLTAALAERATVTMGYAQLFRDYAAPVIQERRDNKAAAKDAKDPVEKDKTQRRAERRVGREAMEARLLSALDSPRQLEEVMTEFWFDHFNVYIGKGLDRAWIAPYEREAIRPHALGKFRDLLGATAHSPAMLFYLDNWQSAAEGSPKRGKGKGGGLNENYARELMELHTLGVDGGYTQKDVTELARILTGWSFDREALRRGEGDGFRFTPRRHDTGTKILLGQTFHDDGEREGEHALDLLADQPATAHHIAFELAQFFVADAPPSALVDRLAKRFKSTDGDIRAVLTTLFKSDEFWAADNVGTKFKSPYRYVISSLRAADAQPDDFRPVIGLLSQLGMPLYGCVTPDGYKNTEAAWLTPGALTQRISFAAGLGAGRLPLARGGKNPGASMDDDNPPKGEMLPAPSIDRLLATVGAQLKPSTRAAIDKAPAALRAGLVFGSPEFQRY